jgi:hypothetical protein
VVVTSFRDNIVGSLMSESTRAFIAQTAKRRDEAQIGMTCKEVIRMMMHLTRGTSNQCENHYDYLIRTGKMPELMNHGRVQRAQQTTTKRSCIRIEQQFRWHMTIKTIWEDHRRFNRNTTMGSGGNKKLPPRRFSTVGIVREFRRSPTQPSPQTSSTWWCRLPLLWRVNYGYAQ